MLTHLPFSFQINFKNVPYKKNSNLVNRLFYKKFKDSSRVQRQTIHVTESYGRSYPINDQCSESYRNHFHCKSIDWFLYGEHWSLMG